jgi:hypothetical protein
VRMGPRLSLDRRQRKGRRRSSSPSRARDPTPRSS